MLLWVSLVSSSVVGLILWMYYSVVSNSLCLVFVIMLVRLVDLLVMIKLLVVIVIGVLNLVVVVCGYVSVLIILLWI